MVRKQIHISLLGLLLAASAQNRCTALVCSCYAPSRNSDSKGEEEIIENSSNHVKKRSGTVGKNIKDGVLIEEEVSDNKNHELLFLNIDGIINGGTNCSSDDGIGGSNDLNIEPIQARKSSLKKTTAILAGDDRGARKKVRWPDSHGENLAHVREFEPSVSDDDGELEGVRRSCVCAIQ